jgi:hypothetical protein
MKAALALVLCCVFPATSFAADTGYKVIYDGGSVPEKSGTSLYFYIQENLLRLVRDGHVLADIPAASVTEISYGQDVHRRVGTAIGLAVVSLGVGALMALSKSKSTSSGSPGLMVTRRVASSCNATRTTTAAF